MMSDRPVSLTRRALLGGLLTSLATGQAALAQEVLRSPRPISRPLTVRERAMSPIEDLIAHAGLTGVIAVSVMDLNAGKIVEDRGGLTPLPPASVAKTLTAAYALEVLGADYRFTTRIAATAPIVDGVIDGDLVLIGDGDPVLDTDNLGDMAQALAGMGLKRVTGRVIVDATALPQVHQIDDTQQVHAGYNPAISGLNLNFNRVHFEWSRGGEGYTVTMDARAARYRPEVRSAIMRIEDRQAPTYTWADQGGIDSWSVAKPALGNGGARWLPVRRPAAYAGEVFHTLMRGAGIELPRPEVGQTADPLIDLLSHQSAPLGDILKDMLLYSTNLTAEVVGLTASKARGVTMDGLAPSAQAMSDWARNRFGMELVSLQDHSGLNGTSEIAAQDLLRLLADPVTQSALAPRLKGVSLLDIKGTPVKNHPVQAVAKTGTLNFVSALSGYVLDDAGQPALAFAILTADPDKRAIAQASGDEIPAGARTWAGRSRNLQRILVERWGTGFVL